ncbi:unnamed protein product [Notodromas monacha]|uniref:Adapter molecule Crk n=1 Tax=Notodromas monacha TaxID=399045 RepID=A0A7R9BDR8_9CRUS|nr:unnamed protein product [Notodromas monacha]CAG0913478.1 unnamed protein product [Notodromas monacha]
MASTFDVLDRDSWYHGPMSRAEATQILDREREGGVFLVRDSTSMKGDYVLCVKEDNKVSHYIINRVPDDDNQKCVYRIGDQTFPDLPELLNFYKLHYLDTTPLTRPAKKKIERVIAKYDFEGNDPDDLPFKKGELLEVLTKDEEQWWTARNSIGQRGSIPVPYVQKVNDSMLAQISNDSMSTSATQDSNDEEFSKPNSRRSERKLPCFARVKQERIPNAYDKTALKLKVGDIVRVTKMNMTGSWEGEIDGRKGYFPFNHVELLDDPSPDGVSKSDEM